MINNCTTISTRQKQIFRKKKTFNTSYYRKQRNGENASHCSIKEYLEKLFQTYDFITTKEYKNPLLMPQHKILNLSDSNPYSIDVLAYHQYRNEIITCEINGKYHYTRTQIRKDEYRKQIIKDFIKDHFVKTVCWLTTGNYYYHEGPTTIDKTNKDGENSITINTFYIPNPYDKKYCHFITHKHAAISKHDVIRKYWDYDTLINFLRL